MATLIVYLSKAPTLHPGGIVVTATPSGVGAARQPPAFMQTGDIYAVQIVEIGALRVLTMQEKADARAQFA